MPLLDNLFWNIIRKNKISNSAWLFLKQNSPLPVVLNLVKPCPTGIEIEVTTRCQLKCRQCEHTYWNEAGRDMTFIEFKYIVGQFPHLRWIGLTGIGSSFINLDFIKMLEYCYSRHILIELFDTFATTNKMQILKAVQYCDHILPSVDAATEETYERLRVGASFNNVIENLKYLLAFTPKKGITPKITFHFVINRMNINEVLDYPGFIKSISGNRPVSIQFSRLLHNFPEINRLFCEVPSGLQSGVEKEGKRLGIPILWNCNVPIKKPTPRQCLEWDEPFIFATGEVIPCCAQNEANRRQFQKSTSLGNIFDQPFEQIWNGKPYSDLRRALRQNKFGEPCRDCVLYQEVNK